MPIAHMQGYPLVLQPILSRHQTQLRHYYSSIPLPIRPYILRQQRYYSHLCWDTHSMPTPPQPISELGQLDATPSAKGEKAMSMQSTNRIGSATTAQTDSQSYLT